MEGTSSFLFIALALSCISGVVPQKTFSYKPRCPASDVDKLEIACEGDNKQICGSNGVTYKNICDFCIARISILRATKNFICVRFEAACDAPEVEADCSPYTSQKSCFHIWTPVCGSDGFSYGNLCAFCVEKNVKPSLYLISEKHCYYDEIRC
ncbi:ovoinhibitor-like [Rhinatrema bivittatum]|uniref:ovoinhibitor-like n=1 Tax=Rhinatrema bivittatum TaxID=194408 RepID=UPI00112C3E18|nr:ovoinhibitor-like [Rhinatrema bivittatum]